MHLNSDSTYLPLDEVFKIFGKSVYTTSLPFLQSGRFPDKMNCTGAQLDLAIYPVFLKFETHFKIEVRSCTGSYHRILKCNRKSRRVDVIESVMRYP